MDRSSHYPLTERALAILSDLGIAVDGASFLERATAFRRICSTWNLAAKLMSKGDLEEHFDAHIADSLSLVPQIHAHSDLHYVDIGPGGGFPAIPVVMALQDRPCLLVERSQTKIDYLRQAVRLLGLSSIHVKLDQFPCPLSVAAGRVYTARAVEKPEIFDAALLSTLQPGDIYLMQRAPSTMGLHSEIRVHEISDAFSESALRRGALYRISR